MQQAAGLFVNGGADGDAGIGGLLAVAVDPMPFFLTNVYGRKDGFLFCGRSVDVVDFVRTVCCL